MIYAPAATTLRGSLRPWPGVRSTLLVLALTSISACGEDSGIVPPEPSPDPVPIGVVLGSVDRSLTVFPVDSPAVTRSIPLGGAGIPTTMAVRGHTVAIAMGDASTVAVFDLGAEVVTSTIPLDGGSGATGIAFVNDSIAIVANPGLNSVTSVNVAAGTTGNSVSVGDRPSAVAARGSRVYVANRTATNSVPTGSGSVTVLDASSLATVATIPLTGLGPTAMRFGPDGRLYVLNSGTPTAGDASVSVVDPNTLSETAHYTGFGESPTSMAFGPDGTLYAASASFGVLAWRVGTRVFARAPAQAITPAGVASAAAVGVDEGGRLYALASTCSGPSLAHRLDASYAVTTSITVGVCPTSIEFAIRAAGP